MADKGVEKEDVRIVGKHPRKLFYQRIVAAVGEKACAHTLAVPSPKDFNELPYNKLGPIIEQGSNDILAARSKASAWRVQRSSGTMRRYREKRRTLNA
jgi:hypothetical protein